MQQPLRLRLSEIDKNVMQVYYLKVQHSKVSNLNRQKTTHSESLTQILKYI